MTLTAPTTPTRRDRWGRLLGRGPGMDESIPLLRPSGLGEYIESRFFLELWSKRMVALGLAARPDLLALAATTSDPDSKEGKKRLNEICNRALEAGGGTVRRDLGTAIHSALQNASETGEVAAIFADEIGAVFNALAEYGFTLLPEYSEVTVANFTHGYGGTADGVLRGPDGQLYFFDLKTGSTLSILGISLQLGAYTHAEYLFRQGAAADGSEDICEPMPAVSRDRAIVIHITPGSTQCNLHWVNTAYGWDLFPIVMTVRETRSRADKIRSFPKVERYTPTATPTVEEAVEMVIDTFPGAELVTHVDDDWRQWMTSRLQAIKDAGAIEALALHWPAVPTIPSGEQITIDQGAEIEAAAALIEQQYELPFPALRTQAAVAEPPKPTAAKRRPRPDEGADVDAEMVTAVNDRAKQLEPDCIAWVGEIITAASKANYPIRISGAGGKKTLRRWYIANALVTLAGFADEALTRALVSLAIGEEVQPGHNIAAAIGSLTIDEAQRLMRLAAGVADTSLTPIWGEDSVTLTGDIQAALAA